MPEQLETPTPQADSPAPQPSSPPSATPAQAAAAMPSPTRQPVPVMIPGMQQPFLTDTVYVSFSAEINPKTTESLLAVFASLVNQKVPHVYLMISTPGGSVMNLA